MIQIALRLCVSAGASGAEVRPGVPPGHEPHEGNAGFRAGRDLEVWMCCNLGVCGLSVIWASLQNVSSECVILVCNIDT